jgi:hypothetical protein
MRTITHYILTALAAVVLLSSCKKWLDVQPKDKFTEPQLFTNLEGASATLNGIYLLLSDAPLYGRNLTMTIPEILAQRYNIGTQHNYTRYQNYQYGEADVKASMESIWQSAYVAIVNANQFVHNLDVYTGADIRAADADIMRGEAIGIRALLHFDMLRMFGPIYNTTDSATKSIPYYRMPSTSIAPLLPAKQVVDSILDDLSVAEKLLEKDPITTQGVVKIVVGDGRDFFRNRNQRINYYAIKALQARVHLYRNNKTEALKAAKAVIDNGSKWFPWLNPSRIISDRVNPDRIFSPELVFCLFNINLYNVNKNIFAPEVTDQNIMAPNDTRLKAIYESNESDYRYNPLWILPSVGGKTYKTFYKYTDVTAIDSSFRFKVPMIRLSEMYYIAAEAEPDATTARGYLNTVRRNRGLADLATSASVTTELQKEYQKEFFGEGQLFFYYKRKNVTTIPNSAATSGNITMSAAKYVIPLPLSETQYR